MKTKKDPIKSMAATRLLITKHVKNGLINSAEVVNALGAAGLHNMNFYYFVYGGALTKVRHGVYKVEHAFKSDTDLVILNAAYKVMGESRAKTKDKKTQPVPPDDLEYKGFVSEQEAVKVLKGLGYKIMKPVNQYEEI